MGDAVTRQSRVTSSLLIRPSESGVGCADLGWKVKLPNRVGLALLPNLGGQAEGSEVR